MPNTSNRHSRSGASRGTNRGGERPHRSYSPSTSTTSSAPARRTEGARPSHARGGSSSYNRGESASGGSSRSYSGGSAARGGYARGGSSHGGGSRGGFSRGGSGGGRGRGRVQKTFDVSQYINKNPIVVTDEEIYTPVHTFKDFGLDAKLADIVIASGITTPTPIQDQIIPHILEGKDVIGLANTGTGKTAAFLVPLIHKTLHEYNRETLILAPTRELAIQIQEELRKLTPGMRLYSTVCVGGTPIRPQIMGLKRKNHFVIGTPGRVIDLMDRGVFRPEKMSAVVLDEADRMLDMGFINDMRKILAELPKDHETLFFSATMSKEIEKLVSDFLHNPIVVSVKKKDITGSIVQDVVHFGGKDKFQTLVDLLADNKAFSRVLIFGAMKHSVEKLGKALTEKGIKAESIHGNKSHPQRQKALKAFKDGYVRVLVATDVAARGIHVDGVSHVINFDLPSTYEDYVHRIGRTGRGDHKGKALTFVE